MRTCSGCKEPKSFELFHRHSTRGYQAYCIPCQNERQKEYKRQRYDARVSKDTKLQRSYGISLADYEQMLADQNGVCKICGKPDPDFALSVDHCHKTGKVRGLLCGSCNFGLGKFYDSPNLLRRAAEYLEFV